jgi:hypothetical protein
VIKRRAHSTRRCGRNKSHPIPRTECCSGFDSSGQL